MEANRLMCEGIRVRTRGNVPLVDGA